MHQLRFTAIFLAVAFFLPELSAATWPPTEKSDTYILRYDAIHHPTRAKTGMVVTQNYLASEVGQAILAHGGTETNRKPEQIGGTNRDTTNRDIHYSPNPYRNKSGHPLFTQSLQTNNKSGHPLFTQPLLVRNRNIHCSNQASISIEVNSTGIIRQFWLDRFGLSTMIIQ
jgi:hypothetical protein